jgi:hypothetical protein
MDHSERSRRLSVWRERNAADAGSLHLSETVLCHELCNATNASRLGHPENADHAPGDMSEHILFVHTMTSLGCELRIEAIPRRLHATPGDPFHHAHLEVALVVTEDAGGATNESARRCCGGYARGYVSSDDAAPHLRTAVDLWNHRDDIDSPDSLDAAAVDRSACRHTHPLFLPRPGRYTAAWYLLYVGFQVFFTASTFDHLVPPLRRLPGFLTASTSDRLVPPPRRLPGHV